MSESSCNTVLIRKLASKSSVERLLSRFRAPKPGIYSYVTSKGMPSAFFGFCGGCDGMGPDGSDESAVHGTYNAKLG